MEVKNKRNLTFLVAGKIVEFYMKGIIYANVAQNASLISCSNITPNNNDQLDKNGVLIEKLQQRGPNN